MKKNLKSLLLGSGVPLSAHLIKISNSGKVSLVNSIWGFHKYCTSVTVTLVVFLLKFWFQGTDLNP